MDLMITIFFVSLIILLLGILVKPLQNIFLTEPLIAMVAGIVLGPALLNIIGTDISHSFTVLEKAAEFTIAMALMATALRIPRHYYTNNFLSQSNIVFSGMILMWLAGSAILYLISGGFSLAECLLLGAIVTPTDPVIASTIVSGEKAEKYLPASVRNTLSFESGVNDGLAYPIVLLSILLVSTPEFNSREWIMQTVLYETVLCGIIAYFVGYLAGITMDKAHQNNLMNTKSVLSFSLGLAFLLLSGLNILQMNGIIGVFIGGIAYSNHISDNEDIQEERVQETMERIFTIPVFFIFGLMLPWQEWFSLGWDAVWIVLLILLLKRIPALLALKPTLPQFKDKFYEVLIMGWYGPIGVAALYYAILAKDKTLFDDAWIIPSLIVFASTLIHGISSLPVEKWYHKKTKLVKTRSGESG